MVSLALDSPALAETYDRVSDRQFTHGKVLIEDLGVSPGERVLDVGCGTGRLAAHVADLVGPSGRVRAIDPLRLRVELAKKKLKTNASASVGRAEDLSAFTDGSFDVVFYNSVLHWMPEKLAALREARRVLRRGGRVGISTAAKERPHDFERVVRKIFAAPEWSHLTSASATPHKVTSDELRQLLDAAGFSGIELRVRTIVDYFSTPEDVLAFNLASSFGNFLAHLDGTERARTESAISTELERFRRERGLRLERHLIFAIARAND